MKVKTCSSKGIFIITFDQDMLVPANQDEYDYSQLFKFKAVSIIDGSSTMDAKTLQNESKFNDKKNQTGKLMT